MQNLIQKVSWSDDKRAIIRSRRHRLKLSPKKKKKTCFLLIKIEHIVTRYAKSHSKYVLV